MGIFRVIALSKTCALGPFHILPLSYSPPSDQSLIAQTQAGDQQAFEGLVKRYEGKVAATVMGMLGPGAEAEDVGQEVFMRFYKAIGNFRGDAALGTYLTRIAMNQCLNVLKRRKRRHIFRRLGRSKEEGDPVLEVPDHGLSQEQRDTQAFVQEALSELKPEFRSVVVLRLLEGYSTRETAELLSLPEGTVLSRLARGQKKLKEIFTNLDHEGDRISLTNQKP